MPIVKQHINLDEDLKQVEEPVLLNDYDFYSEADRAYIKEITTETIDDSLTMLPQCDCGKVYGGYKLGDKCTECNSVVRHKLIKDLEYKPKLWFASITKDNENNWVQFLNPDFYGQLEIIVSPQKRGRDAERDSTKENKLRFSLLRWLSDSMYNTDKAPLDKLTIFNQIEGFERSHSYFIANFERLLTLFKETLTTDKRADVEYMLAYYRKNKNTLLSTVLPLVDKKLNIEENSATKYVTETYSDVNNIINTYFKNKDSEDPKVLDRTMARLNYYLSVLNRDLITTVVSKKHGLGRKHLLSSKLDYSGRLVITPLLGKHRHDEITLPYTFGTVMFRPHIMNRLMRKYPLKVCVAKLHQAYLIYDPEVGDILDSLITEARDGNLYVMIHRNPVLLRGSMQRVKVRAFTKDVRNHTMAISMLVCALSNVDVDGDVLNVCALLDNWTADALSELDAYKSVAGVERPGEVSGVIGLLDTVATNLVNHIYKEAGGPIHN
jgi:hypothetical protein